MLLIQPSRPIKTEGNSAASSRLLASGALGSRLIAAARAAAAMHMAQSVTQRNDGAQIVPRTKGAR